MTVTIIDYGVGNLGSIRNMFARLGIATVSTSSAPEVADAERLLLPGVGAFDTAMTELRRRGMDKPLREFAESGRPMLGICLGMQLLLDGSDEGHSKGLGIIPGRSVRLTLTFTHGGRVPHMGWNSLRSERQHPILAGLDDANRFYFVHSYRVIPESEEAVLGRTEYGEEFVSAVWRENVVGVQFHPEKSHHFGAALLRNFAEA